MRRWPSALLLACLAALVAPGTAFAQDAAELPAGAAPPAVQAAPPGAVEPGDAAPPVAVEPGDAAPPVAVQPVEAASPVVAETAPAAAGEAALPDVPEAAAPPAAARAVPRAGPAPAADPPAVVDARPQAKRVRTPRRTARRHRAPNMQQGEGRLDFFGGRVTIGDVPQAECPQSDLCEGKQPIADYEVRDLEVRAERDGRALLTVTSARSAGPRDDRRIEAEVVLRREDGSEVTGDLVLRPDQNLLDPTTYEGTGLAAAFADVQEALAPLTGEGGALENLVIVFGAGFVQPDGVAAVAVSAAGERVAVLAPSPGRLHFTEPPPRVLRESLPATDGDDDIVEDTAEALGPALVVQAGGSVTSGVVDLAGGVAGALVVGSCEALGGENCESDDPPPPPPFVLDALSAVVFIGPGGSGVVQVRCPSGYDGVSGVLRLETEIRLGQPFRRLADDVRFTCDEPVEELLVQLRPEALERLEREGSLLALVTASVSGPEARTARDVDEDVAVRLRSGERPSG